MQLYYKIANHVAFRIYVHGLDHADKVQECVLKTWRALGEYPKESFSPLIYKIMKNHLISLSRPTYAERKLTTYSIDIGMLSHNQTKIVIPLPLENPERIIVVAWMENDCKLRKACDSLGWEYREGLGIWNSAKAAIREKGISACEMDEEQVLVRSFL